MNWWHYLILANLYLALFYGFYLLLLRKETYFMLNRIYLVSAAILSFFIPLMQSEWVKNLFITQKVQQTIYYINPSFVYQVSPSADSGFTISQFFTSVYWLVSMLLLARLFYRLFLLKRYLNSAETGRAFSFFGKVKVDENLPQKEVIKQHEMVHVLQLHSADVLLFELLAILNWFNPVIYFYRKAIKHIHEFIADRKAISFGVDKSDYALLLLSQSIGIEPNTLTNSFFNQTLLKQRIMMLHKNPSRRAALLKYGLSAPLFAAMLILTSATVSEQKTIKVISDKISSDAPVNTVVRNIGDGISSPTKTTLTEKTMVKTVSTLNGKVVNASGEPLAGFSVTYSKKHIGSITSKVGNFTIPNYEEGDILTFNLKSKGYEILKKSFENIAEKPSLVVLLSLRSNLIPRPIADSIKFSKPVSFTAVERLPSFPGEVDGLSKYLAKSIRYPKVAKENKITGRVIITFIVEKNGKLSNIKVLRDIGGGCGAEAARVLSASPTWIPGIQDGKPVRVSYVMPVNFTLEGNKKNLPSTKTTRLDSASNPELYNRGVEVMKKITNFTVSGFGGPDSARQRKPSETIPLQAKMMGLNDPAYILDGTTITKDEFSKIKPNDIESVSVFKSPMATAKFGDKGKNGVIEITMKKGKKP